MSNKFRYHVKQVLDISIEIFMQSVRLECIKLFSNIPTNISIYLPTCTIYLKNLKNSKHILFQKIVNIYYSKKQAILFQKTGHIIPKNRPYNSLSLVNV